MANEINVPGKHVYGSARVCGSAMVYGSAMVCGSARVCLAARITNSRDYIAIGPIGSRESSTLTAWRDVAGIGINTGCFSGTIAEFEKKLRSTHEKGSVHRHEYEAALALVRLRAKEWKPITKAEKSDSEQRSGT